MKSSERAVGLQDSCDGCQLESSCSRSPPFPHALTAAFKPSSPQSTPLESPNPTEMKCLLSSNCAYTRLILITLASHAIAKCLTMFNRSYKDGKFVLEEDRSGSGLPPYDWHANAGATVRGYKELMVRFALIAAVVATLLSFSGDADAMCLACPNCDYDTISSTVGNACLNYWTCSGSVVTCYYPSVEYPGTFSACQFTGTQTQYGYYEFALTSGPSVCDGLAMGDNSKCQPSNNPWDWVDNVCTAAEAYVGEPNSGLL